MYRRCRRRYLMRAGVTAASKGVATVIAANEGIFPKLRSTNKEPGAAWRRLNCLNYSNYGGSSAKGILYNYRGSSTRGTRSNFGGTRNRPAATNLYVGDEPRTSLALRRSAGLSFPRARPDIGVIEGDY
ncbi:hypothetical protein GE21DRAFT_1276993 [Neurospora crassa]|nr:hypothetical protein GE21DRAFT_1276993 [Neurospora crassa]